MSFSEAPTARKRNPIRRSTYDPPERAGVSWLGPDRFHHRPGRRTPVRIARLISNGRTMAGVVNDSTVDEVDVTLRELLVLAAAGREVNPGQAVRERGHQLDDVTLASPLVPDAGRVFCVGINYLAHQQESADAFVADVPTKPIIFLKNPSAMASPHADLHLWASVSTSFDWEVELGVVIGASGYRVQRDQAWDLVAGYTVVNDITARDLQQEHVQWCLGKNVEHATPVGPWVVSRNEIGTDPDLELTLRVNGEVKQRGRTSSLIFDIPTLIETISRVTTLHPGDLIATGTPAGGGFKRTPPEFLRHGDVVETTVEGIGTLCNRVVANG